MIKRLLRKFKDETKTKNDELFSYRFGFAMVENTSKPNTEMINDWRTTLIKDYVIYSDPNTTVLKVETEKGLLV